MKEIPPNRGHRSVVKRFEACSIATSIRDFMMHDETEDDEISLSPNDIFGIGGTWKWVSNDFYQHSFTRH